MELVINEWFPEYCRPEATKESRQMLQSFLERFLQNDDVICVRNPSPFLTKIYRYAKEYQSHSDTRSILILSRFIKAVLLNSKKCKFITGEHDLDEVVLEKLSHGNYASDKYLFEAAVMTGSKIIITTDQRLYNHFRDIDVFTIVMLPDFLANY